MFCVLCLMLQSGCGGTTAPPEQAVQEWSPATTFGEKQPQQTASREHSPSDQGIELVSATSAADDRPIKGSPEWLLMEIAHLRNTPTDVMRQPVAGRVGEYEHIRLSPEQSVQEQTRRYEKTIELAMQTISKTHEAPGAEKLFNSAVHYLADARMQLALAGQHEHAQLLDENAEALFMRDSTSFAAMEAASHVLQLTRTMADQHAEDDQQWAVAFARQARLFAERFPQETSLAAVNVIAAGHICEQLQLQEETQACYAVIEKNYPESPYAAQVAGSLRRLRLPGQPLTEFGGSTFDGSFISIEQFRGKNLLIAFWAANSAEFRKDLPIIQSLVTRSNGQLNVIGVNLDREDTAVHKFIQETGIRWKHMFYSDPEKRGAQNVIARHYGVRNVPEYWLVDADGIVRSIHLDGAHLERDVQEALNR